MSDQKMLFAPGPVLTSRKVKEAVLHSDICHRTSDFETVFQKLRSNLVRLFKGDPRRYCSCVVSGSGTASNEAVLSSVLPKTGKVLLISNGEFGLRLRKILECYDLPFHCIALEWGKYPDLNEIEEALKRDRDISLVTMVFHETSTGMINPVHEVGRLAKRYNKMFFVDAISAIGGEDVDVVQDHIDFCTGVPNKCVSGLTGVSFICISRSRIGEIESNRRRNIYLNLQRYIEMAETLNQTPNTPSISMFLALNESLQELFEEGLANRIDRYRRNAQIIREGLRRVGFELLLKNSALMSNTVTSAFLPEKVRLADFIKALYDEGYVIYSGKGPLLQRNMFQVANMGLIDDKDCHKFNEVLMRVAKRMNISAS